METAWEKETDPWSVIRRPVSAGGWCAPSFHPTPTTWAQDLLAHGVGAAGVGGAVIVALRAGLGVCGLSMWRVGRERGEAESHSRRVTAGPRTT